VNGEASACRLTVGGEILLDGPPNAVRTLARLIIEEGRERIEVVLDDGSGAVVRLRTTGDRLRLTEAPGPVLVVEGGDRALELFADALRRVADEADEVGWAPVGRHEHLESWGDDDPRFTPDSEPVIVGSDWPDPPSPT
jgi:hypothetical protein